MIFNQYWDDEMNMDISAQEMGMYELGDLSIQRTN